MKHTFLLTTISLLLVFVVSCERVDEFVDQTAELEGDWQRSRLVWYYAPDDSSVTNYTEPVEIYQVSNEIMNVYYSIGSNSITFRQYDYYIHDGVLYLGSKRLNSFKASYNFSLIGDTLSLRSEHAHIMSIPYAYDGLPEHWPTTIDTVDMDSLVTNW